MGEHLAAVTWNAKLRTRILKPNCSFLAASKSSRLLNDSFQRVGLERLVLWNDNGPSFFAENQVRASLSEFDEAQPPQSFGCVRAADIAGKFHATARIGSVMK